MKNQERTPEEELHDLIARHEQMRIQQEEDLKNEVKDFIEQLRPGNLIRKGISSLIPSPGVRRETMQAGLATSAGYLSKKLLLGTKGGVLVTIIGFIVQKVISGMVRRKLQNAKILN